MKLNVTQAATGKVDNLVLFIKRNEILGPWKKIDAGLKKQLDRQAKRENFKGKKDQLLCLYPDGKVERVIAVGVDGKPEEGEEYIRRAASLACAKARAFDTARVTVLLPNDKAAQAAGEGFLLASYTFSKYKSSQNGQGKGIRQLTLIGGKGAAAGVRKAEIYADATCKSRDLVNEHAGVMTPRRLADEARKACKGLKVNVHDEKWIEKKGMNALRAVSLGSNQPPRLVHIEYKVPGAKKSVAIVGKGITFDSGGLCIKPAGAMMEMKADMSGAATVVGVMSAVKRLKPKVNVHGFFAASENMPGQGAYKMRDVIRASNGKTMEITNTDAEGRVVLSDALAYASTLKPDAIIDMATLTGAVVVALGPKWSGIFGTNQKLIDSLCKAGREAGERIWQLPLEDEYFEDFMKSDVADMKNSGGRWGGAIQGALFLKQYVDPKIPWAHIDMAGPAIEMSKKYYNPGGASGVITRSILRYLESF